MGDVSVLDAISPIVKVKLYGDLINDFNIDPALMTRIGIPTRAGEKPQLALIRAFRFGRTCRQLPLPMMFTVFGSGVDADPADECAGDASKVWTVALDTPVATVAIERGELAELLEDAEEKGISGGVKIQDVRYESGKIRGSIKIWAKIKVFGASAKVNETFGFSIPVGGCHTVFDAGIAKVKLCFKAPNRICAELCVGKWGVSKCWDECVTVDLPVTADGRGLAASEECECTE